MIVESIEEMTSAQGVQGEFVDDYDWRRYVLTLRSCSLHAAALLSLPLPASSHHAMVDVEQVKLDARVQRRVCPRVDVGPALWVL